MKNTPVIMNVLANQLCCPGDVPVSRKEQDITVDRKCGILEQKLISHMQIHKHSNAKSFSEHLQFTEDEIYEVNVATKKQWLCKQWFIKIWICYSIEG